MIGSKVSIFLQHAAGTHFTSHTHFAGELVINAEEGCTLALIRCKNAVHLVVTSEEEKKLLHGTMNGIRV